MSDLKTKLKTVRRFTGDFFSPARGYHAGRPLNFGQRMAIEKYYNKISELTAKPFEVYVPRKGEKKEAFSFTGQTGFPRFKAALIHKVDKSAKNDYFLDKSRPTGSRFVVANRKTGQKFYHIPAKVFTVVELPPEFYDWLSDQDLDPEDLSEEDLDTHYYRYVLELYADDAEFYLIQAGESYMWGAGGGKATVSEKIRNIISSYGAQNFDAHNRRSSYYGNWFRGVTAFTNRFDAFPMVGEGLRKRRERLEKYNLGEKKFRELKDGSIGMFFNGRLQERIFVERKK